MSFETMKKQLLQEFRKNKDVWSDCVDNGRQKHSQKFIIDEPRKLSIAYPGYNTTRRKDGSIVYDYRVDFGGYTITHVNIIEYLHHRVNIQSDSKKQLFANRLIEFLIELAKEGNSIEPKSFNDLLQIEDLTLLIPWIALQEDINHPMTELRKDGKFKEGRRMSFKRYIESVYSAIAEDQGNYSLAQVIKRAEIRPGDRMPKDWPDKYLESAYSAIDAIGDLAE